MTALVYSPPADMCSSFSTSLPEFAHLCAYEQRGLGLGMSDNKNGAGEGGRAALHGRRAAAGAV